MSTDRQTRSRVSLAVTLVVALIAAMMSIGVSPARAANEGTLKIYQTKTNCELNSNDPKILSPYWIGGFNFDANADFQITIKTQPDGELAETVTGTTDADGSFCAGPVTTEPGMYKAEITGAGEKSKVFDVQVAPPVEVAVTAPTFTDATCENLEGSAMTIPADTDQIDYTTTGTAAPGNTVTVTAAPIGNVVLTGYPTDGWSHTFATIESLECDDVVGGTEETDTEESGGSDDEAVAGSEDELASTGANVGPLGLGLLLILSGAAFVAARRLALR